MVALIILSSALICFQGQCHHALVGSDTPTGVFSVVHMLTDQPGYGGDVLVFAQTKTTVFAIHRVWLRIPTQHRAERLASDDPIERKTVTRGCINVAPDIYDELQDLTTVEIRQDP
jgi:uncharacterized membrane protein